MTRLNISLKNDIVKALEEISEKDGKTVSSIVSEASAIYLEAEKLGLRLTDVMKAVRILGLTEQINAIPVPGILLDRMIELSYKYSDKESREIWFERGRVLGNIMKAYASTIEDFSGFISEYRLFLPADLFEVEVDQGNVAIVLSGAGYSQEAAICTAEGVSGFLSAYGYEPDGSETSEGFIKVSATKKK